MCANPTEAEANGRRTAGSKRPRRLLRALSALALFTCAFPAIAAEEIRMEGATIRLVAEPPDEAGRIRGAVLFELEPGWKTYWLDPGESGLPPRLDFSVSEGVDPPRIAFPAPSRLETEGERLNGYDEPMAVAFETTGRSGGRLVLSLQAGLCRTLCVPVATVLERDLDEPLPMADAVAIDRAFMALPEGEERANGRIEGDTLVVELPDGREGDLFVAGPAGWRFGAPEAGDGPSRRIPVRERPRDGAAPDAPLHGIFVADDRTFALTIALP